MLIDMGLYRALESVIQGLNLEWSLCASTVPSENQPQSPGRTGRRVIATQR